MEIFTIVLFILTVLVFLLWLIAKPKTPWWFSAVWIANSAIWIARAIWE